MQNYILTFLVIFTSATSFSQEIINPPADQPGQMYGYAEFENIEISYNDRSSESAHGTLIGENQPRKSYLTCVTTPSKRVNLSYITTDTQIGNRKLLGNFSFESFDKCKMVALKMADNPGRKVRFKLALDSFDVNNGKILSVEWID